MRPFYFLGLDLGQRSDYTALAVVEEPLWVTEAAQLAGNKTGWISPADLPPAVRERAATAEGPEAPTLALRHLERFPLGTPYPAIVERVAALLSQPPLAGHTSLVVDATGVGRPVVDMLQQANLKPIAVTITGGGSVVRDGRDLRVPKRDLAMTVQTLLQSRRLTFAAALPLIDTLTAELQAFEVKINPDTAHDSYLSWRDGMHDDLVLAVSLACWYRNHLNPHGARGFSMKYTSSTRWTG